MFMYIGTSVSWCSMKQLVVALSTCEEEYIDNALSACQNIWLINLLQEMKFKVSKSIRLMIDNKSSISIAKNPMMYGRSKHIDTKYHYMHNQVHNGVLEDVHVNTQK